MKKQKLYIVEDELNNSERLEFLLDRYFREEIEVIGCAEGIMEASEFLRNHHADILLLDIELADGQVFDLLRMIDYRKYKLIFITGYSEHAIRAIKYAAVDYLLKPVDAEELIGAIRKVQQGSQADNVILEDALQRKRFEFDQFLIINSLSAIERIPFASVSHLCADGVYTQVHHDGKITISSKPIGVYEDVLPPSIFCRCHKSYIVNKSFIKRIGKGRGLNLTLFNGEELPVSVRKKEEFMEWFEG